MSVLKLAFTSLLALAIAVPALAVPITYQASVEINWNNGYTGTRFTKDTTATVIVDYTGGGGFTITSLVFDANEPGIGLITLGAAGNTSGTITGGVATGLMGYSGKAAGVYNLLNTNGQYTGTVANGVGFSAGDVYQLRLFNLGTVSPAIAGSGIWNHLSSLDDTPENDQGTRIIFGVPEPATLGLVLFGLPFMVRRRG